MFPEAFNWDGKLNVVYTHLKIKYRIIENEYDFENNLEDDFWLAEKVGLFDFYSLSRFDENDFMIMSKLDNMEKYLDSTIPEVICKAILEIYGKKC